MRNLILAFGLLILPAVVMAAPPQPSSCNIMSSSTTFTTTGCTATEPKLIVAAQTKPSTKQVNKALVHLAGKEYLTINTLCKLKGGRRKVPRSSVQRCFRRAGEGQRLILRNALNNLSSIKDCKGVKRLGEQVNCMIDQNNKLLLPLIESTLDAHKAYMKGLKFMIDHGCSLKSGKLECANSTGLVLAILVLLLVRIVRRRRRIQRAARIAKLKTIIETNRWAHDMSSYQFWMDCRKNGQIHLAQVAYTEWLKATQELKAMQG